MPPKRVLALDPATRGTFWYGADQSNNRCHLAANGTVLKADDLTRQGRWERRY